jgi:hypothetical protein
VALGVAADNLNCLVHTSHPELLPLWRKLPAGGAYRGCGTELPRSHRFQRESDALVAEAAADLAEAGYPLSPTHSVRQNVVRLLVAMFAITGTLNLRRGWVRSVMLAIEAAGCPATTATATRWYRVSLADDPEQFSGVPGLDASAFADLCLRSGLGRD